MECVRDSGFSATVVAATEWRRYVRTARTAEAPNGGDLPGRHGERRGRGRDACAAGMADVRNRMRWRDGTHSGQGGGGAGGAGNGGGGGGGGRGGRGR